MTGQDTGGVVRRTAHANLTPTPHTTMDTASVVDSSMQSTSSSDNEDGVGNIYFGPMLSPEKKQLASHPTSSPTISFPFTFAAAPSDLRRSPRLSSSPLRSDAFVHPNTMQEDDNDGEDEEDPIGVRPSVPWGGTPLQSILRRDGVCITRSVN